tara:strand:- start:250 stop:495 length:246 start_codon:yes stop_codon:yes gene_type:complete
VSEIPFGGILSSKMKIGSLVSWAEWKIADNDLVDEVYYGTIVDKITKIEGNRSIVVVLVACSKTGDIISLNPFQLRLEGTN